MAVDQSAELRVEEEIKSGDRIRMNGTTALVEILRKAAQPKSDLFGV
jgi:hypothetical protein